MLYRKNGASGNNHNYNKSNNNSKSGSNNSYSYTCNLASGRRLQRKFQCFKSPLTWLIYLTRKMSTKAWVVAVVNKKVNPLIFFLFFQFSLFVFVHLVLTAFFFQFPRNICSPSAFFLKLIVLLVIICLREILFVSVTSESKLSLVKQWLSKNG